MGIKIETKNAELYYGEFHALKNVSMQIQEKTVTALIGPSGCGKSTFLRLFNRMNDLIEGVRISGDISVSYTHLRAHETVLDLVCRLLLEKKTTHNTH